MSSPYTNTFLYVSKVWLNSLASPVPSAPPSLMPKGGMSLFYSSRLQILLGKQLTSGCKRLTATSKGFTYSYGIETSIKILKNHLDAPHNVCYEGKMIASDIGFVALDDLEAYKKEHIGSILKELNKMSEGKVIIKEDDVLFSEEEIEDDVE